MPAFIRLLLLALACWIGSGAQAEALAAAATPALATTGGDYVLGTGDRVRVTVFQSPELSMEVRIPESGIVSYPLAGPIALGGLTQTQAERRVAETLVAARLVRQPQVSIAIVEIHGNQAAVLGFAVRPGRYALDSGSMRLSELMALAGGILPDASDLLTVTGTRDGQPLRLSVDFRRLSTGADPAHDIVMRNSDMVYVARAPHVYIHGEVQRPGTLRLEPGMRVLHALAAAGGVTLRGTQRGILVSRVGPDGQLQDTKPGLQAVLQPDDVVYVPESLF